MFSCSGLLRLILVLACSEARLYHTYLFSRRRIMSVPSWFLLLLLIYHGKWGLLAINGVSVGLSVCLSQVGCGESGLPFCLVCMASSLLRFSSICLWC